MFGNELKEIRKIHKKSQVEVANATGIPQTTISFIESDKGIPNIYQCIKLADFYDVSLDELIGREFPNK